MASKYGSMKKAFATPGMQEGEKDALAAIAKNRGVSMKKAAAIGKKRTAKGLNTAGVKGPKGMGPHDRKIASGQAKPKRPSKPADPAKGRGTNRPTPTLTETADPRLKIPANLIPGRTGGGKNAGPGAPTTPGPKPLPTKDISKATGRARKQAK